VLVESFADFVYTLTRDILISNAKSSAMLCDCDVGEDLEDGDADKVIVKAFLVEAHEPDEPLRTSKHLAHGLYEAGVELRDLQSTSHIADDWLRMKRPESLGNLPAVHVESTWIFGDKAA
jgi:hypothetical protein